MKKILITLFAILYIVIFINHSDAFLSNSNEKGFYSNIAENINELENNLFSIDLIGDNGTKNQINSLMGDNCLNSDLSEDEIRNIVSGGDLSIILTKINSNCKESDGNISTTLILKLTNAVNQIYSENKEISSRKTRQILNLGSTGIYSDGIENNGPFDLIIDLLNIDSIIFMEESTEYEGNTFFDLGDKIKDLLKDVNQINKNIDSGNNLNNFSSINQANSTNNDIPFFLNSINSQAIYSQNVCLIENSTSGLNLDSTNFLIGATGDTFVDGNIVNSGLSNTGGLNNNEDKIVNIKNKSSNYSKITDNIVFPCDSIFCIDIEFITYNHNLLGGDFQDITIEYLINRSNEHLKKFTSTSLLPAKMSMNNFELGLKDLNLPDIFHLGFQISTKPVPILEIEDENKEENDIFSTNNLLKSYYKSYGLDYERRNDLSLLKNIEADKQIGLNSSMLSNSNFLNNASNYNNYLSNIGEQRNTITKAIENNTKNDIVGDFERQFKELEIFNKSINNYVNNLDALVRNLKKIPVDTGAN